MFGIFVISYVSINLLFSVKNGLIDNVEWIS